jgi:hypothetical protein
MAARFEDRERQPASLLPSMAKEVVFWCAVLVAVISGAVLVGRLGTIW